ncbi:putative bifunctional inhibitor/plant lipid transfer protein/seed storage helical [Helianthus debilis subsp. tardiflorus]|nr:putative bifunctional inhibitor/plant lipid transfer protein/seed storage helical [Helianthus annuus]
MKVSNFLCVMLMVLMINLMVQVQVGMAVECDRMKLFPCLSFIVENKPPPPNSPCCNGLHEQSGCLCGYVKDPSLWKYLKMPGAKTVARACNIVIPDPGTCH